MTMGLRHSLLFQVQQSNEACFHARSFPLSTAAGECLWTDLDLIKDVTTDCKTLFPVVSYATTSIPTYPCGQIGFVLATKNQVCIHCRILPSKCPWVLEIHWPKSGGGCLHGEATCVNC